jgi:hypothetical protein
MAAESIDSRWWRWPPFAGRAWKSRYSVSGTLTNLATAAMLPTATDPGVLLPVDSLSPTPLRSGTSMAFTRSGIVQRWRWTGGPHWFRTAPTDRVFVYTAEFDLVDEYGNAYPTAISTAESLLVSVSQKKKGFQSAANVQAALSASAFLAAAGLAFINPVAAAIALEAAWLNWALSIWNGAQAEDPPVPDFRYDEHVGLEFPTVPMPDDAGDALLALAE